MFHTPTMGAAVGGVELGVSYRMPPIPRGATRVLIDSGAQANCTGISAHVPGSRAQPDGSTGRPGAICGGSGGACEVTYMQTTMAIDATTVQVIFRRTLVHGNCS